MTAAPSNSRELVLDRHLAAPRAAVWRCWTEAELLMRWFVPAPWTVSEATLDVRPGGAFRVVMRDPEGADHPNSGVYLEVDTGRRLVFTDAYVGDWQPAQKAFFTAIITFDDARGGTHYVARARHWREEDRAAHEAMGFHEGWGKCADLLETLAQSMT